MGLTPTRESSPASGQPQHTNNNNNPLSESDKRRLSRRISDIMSGDTAMNHRVAVERNSAKNKKKRLSIASSVRKIKEALENLGVLTIMKDEMASIVNSEDFSDLMIFIPNVKRYHNAAFRL